MAGAQTVLFLSNGYGEDSNTCSIIENLLKEHPSLGVKALPLVGEGNPYRKLNIQILGPCKKMPSDGFIEGNFFYFLRDLKSGWLKMYLQKIKAVRAKRDQIKLIVCVGDVFLLLTSVLFFRKPVVFLPGAKSDYIKEHYLIEKWLMKLSCKLVIARDERTALSLRDYGINAIYVGNVAMDSLRITGENFGMEKSLPVVGLIPGSRKEAYENLRVILEVVREISLQDQIRVNFFLALAPLLDVEKIVNLLQSSHWKMSDASREEKKKGIVSYLISTEGVVVKVIQGKFGDVINLSKVVIGTAGTANEQAVGLGKPVVTFPGQGPQITEKFLHNQQKLLGKCVFVVRKDAKAISSKVLSLLENSQKLAEIAKIGKGIMGGPGATPRITRLIYEELSKVG